jgi:hypothetical protein
MKDHATFRKYGLSFVPLGRDSRELLASVKDGAAILLQVWLPRNMAQHRKYFAVLNNVVEATGDRWASTEHLRKDVLETLGHYDDVVNQFTGEVRRVVHSMAVASMPRAEFERLYDDTIKLLTEALGCDPEMLLDEAA